MTFLPQQLLPINNTLPVLAPINQQDGYNVLTVVGPEKPGQKLVILTDYGPIEIKNTSYSHDYPTYFKSHSNRRYKERCSHSRRYQRHHKDFDYSGCRRPFDWYSRSRYSKVIHEDAVIQSKRDNGWVPIAQYFNVNSGYAAYESPSASETSSSEE